MGYGGMPLPSMGMPAYPQQAGPPQVAIAQAYPVVEGQGHGQVAYGQPPSPYGQPQYPPQYNGYGAAAPPPQYNNGYGGQPQRIVVEERRGNGMNPGMAVLGGFILGDMIGGGF